MTNPLANAEALRATWARELSWHQADAKAVNATLTDKQLGAALDAAFPDVQERFERLRDDLLAKATRSLISEFFTLCEECRRLIPKAEASEVNPYHAAACSLHPDNVVGG